MRFAFGIFFVVSSRRRHTRFDCDWSSDVCSADLSFFFQAEDGIRDYKVTGVQTCALPISGQVRSKRENIDAHKSGEVHWDRFDLDDVSVRVYGETAVVSGHLTRKGKIGRASCRERV